MYIKQPLIYFIIFFVFFGCSNPREQKWSEDIDYFGETLSQRHIDFEKIIDNRVFESELKSLKRKINGLMDYEIVLKLQTILAKLNVSHTGINIHRNIRVHQLPIYFEIFDDGLYITAIESSKSSFLKKRVVAINNLPIDTVYNKLAKIISYENDYWLKHKLTSVLNIPEILNFCGIVKAKQDVSFTFEDGSELKINSRRKNNNIEYVKSLTNSMWLKNQSKFYWYKLIDKNILYIQYNRCYNDKNYPFNQYILDIDSILANNMIEKLIIDLRLNTGGNSEIIKPLISKIERKENLSIYTCISRRTYSSGRFAAIDCKNELGSILIGEPTGGSPNSYGEVRTFSLPHSGITVDYSTKFWSLMDTEEKYIKPDIKIKYSSIKYLNGIDPVLEYIVKK